MPGQGPPPGPGARGDALSALFETVRVVDGRARRLAQHHARMTASAAVLGLAPPPALSVWQRRLGASADGLVRLDWDSVSLALGWRPLPLRSPPTLCPVTVEPGPLACHKTADRTVYDRARAAARAEGFDDALLVDDAGWLLETSVANVFVRLGATLVTPPADRRILPGIARAALIRTGAASERPVHLDEALCADGLLLTSAAHDGLPVSRLQIVCFDTGATGQ